MPLEVKQHLPQSSGIPRHPRRHVGLYHTTQFEPLAMRPLGEEVQDIFHHPLHAEIEMLSVA